MARPADAHLEPFRQLRPPTAAELEADADAARRRFADDYSAACPEAFRLVDARAGNDGDLRARLREDCNRYALERHAEWWAAWPRQRHPLLAAEDEEFERNSHVTTDGKVRDRLRRFCCRSRTLTARCTRTLPQGRARIDLSATECGRTPCAPGCGLSGSCKPNGASWLVPVSASGVDSHRPVASGRASAALRESLAPARGPTKAPVTSPALAPGSS